MLVVSRILIIGRLACELQGLLANDFRICVSFLYVHYCLQSPEGKKHRLADSAIFPVNIQRLTSLRFSIRELTLLKGSPCAIRKGGGDLFVLSVQLTIQNQRALQLFLSLVTNAEPIVSLPNRFAHLRLNFGLVLELIFQSF